MWAPPWQEHPSYSSVGRATAFRTVEQENRDMLVAACRHDFVCHCDFYAPLQFAHRTVRRLALSYAQLNDWSIRSAANPELLPKAKPRAMREHFVVPSIRGRDVAWAQRANIRRFEPLL